MLSLETAAQLVSDTFPCEDVSFHWHDSAYNSIELVASVRNVHDEVYHFLCYVQTDGLVRLRPSINVDDAKKCMSNPKQCSVSMLTIRA